MQYKKEKRKSKYGKRTVYKTTAEVKTLCYWCLYTRGSSIKVDQANLSQGCIQQFSPKTCKFCLQCQFCTMQGD